MKLKFVCAGPFRSWYFGLCVNERVSRTARATPYLKMARCKTAGLHFAHPYSRRSEEKTGSISYNHTLYIHIYRIWKRKPIFHHSFSFLATTTQGSLMNQLLNFGSPRICAWSMASVPLLARCAPSLSPLFAPSSSTSSTVAPIS